MQLSLFQPEPLGESNPASNQVPLAPLRMRAGKEVHENVSRKRDLISGQLEPCIPGFSVEYVTEWFVDQNVLLRISKNRSSKLGDYRPPKPGLPARISVNHNLNKYSFLITLVHEMAHHMVLGNIAGNQVLSAFRRNKIPKPHGPEWKSRFRKLMAPLLDPAILPPDVIARMMQYLENPKASTAADAGLLKILKKYDKPDGSELLENLPFNAVFRLGNGRTFHKKEKIRTRYRCISADNGRIYLFNPMARVYVKGN